MTRLSASDLAFSGFRMTRERFVTILCWAALYLAFSLLSTLLMITVAPGAMEQLQAASTPGQQPDLAQMQSAMARFGGVFALLLPLSLLYAGVQYAAAYRAYLRPGEHAPHNLALGMQELRQLGVAAALYVLLVLYIVVIAIVAALVGGGVGAVLPEGAARAGWGFLVFVAAVGALVYPLLRLSLAGAQTFAERRFTIFGSWRLTKGQVWPLFVAYLLVVLLMTVIGLLFVVILGALVGVAALSGGQGLEGLAGAMQPDTSSFAAYFTLPTIVGVVAGSLLNALFLALVTGPAATAYRQLASAGAEPTEYDRVV